MSLSRILVVDDEEGVRDVVVEALERIEGAEVVDEGDPARALERLKEQAFDVLVTDIRMPGMDGVALLRAAREHDPRLPVLMLTAFTLNVSFITNLTARFARGGKLTPRRNLFLYGIGYGAAATSCTAPIFLGLIFLALASGGIAGATLRSSWHGLEVDGLELAQARFSAAWPPQRPA